MAVTLNWQIKRFFAQLIGDLLGMTIKLGLLASTLVLASCFSTADWKLETRVEGSGTITSSPAGIDCGTDCKHFYPHDTQVSLTATPDAGFQFVEWIGYCSGSGDCVVSMVKNQKAGAIFAPVSDQVNLAVTTNGSGTVSSEPQGIDCGSQCNADFDSGTQVTLTALPDQGFNFSGWSGACEGLDLSCQLTLDSSQNVTANFSSASTNASLVVNHSGGGRVTSIPAGIDCGSQCSVEFDIDESVVLTAQANEGFEFSGWSGDCLGQGECNLTLDDNKNVSASFTEISTGSLSIDDMGLHTVSHGDVFTFQPTIRGDYHICRKDLAHDDVEVDSETGLIRWDTSG